MPVTSKQKKSSPSSVPEPSLGSSSNEVSEAPLMQEKASSIDKSSSPSLIDTEDIDAIEAKTNKKRKKAFQDEFLEDSVSAPLVLPPYEAMAQGFESLGNAKKLDKIIDEMKVTHHDNADALIGLGGDVLEVSAEIEGGTGVTSDKLDNNVEGSSDSNAADWGGLAVSSVGTLIKIALLYKKWQEAKKDDEYDIEGGCLLAAELFHNAAATAEAIFDIVNKVPKSLEVGVPAIGAAVSLVKIILDGIALRKEDQMKDSLSKENKKFLLSKQGLADMESAVSQYKIHDALISNTDYRIKLDMLKLTELKKGNGEIKNKKEIAKLSERVKERSIFVINNKEPMSTPTLSRDDIAEYALVKELIAVNKKRMIRLRISLASEVVKIGGYIAILSGAGALIGASVNTSVAVANGGIVVARKAKQAAHNRAGRKQGKGKGIGNVGLIGGNATKSSAAKADYRLEQVQTIVTRVKKVRTPKVKLFIEAAGADSKKLITKNGKPKEQIKMLYTAIGKR